MKTPPLSPPYPEGPSQPQQPPQPDNPSGFSNFVGNTNFLRHVSDPNLPVKGTGPFVPLWVAPREAQKILMEYGESGLAIPHPNIDINDLTK